MKNALNDTEQLKEFAVKLKELQLNTEKKIKDVAVYRKYNNILIKLIITLVVSYSLVSMCFFVSCAIIVNKICNREIITKYERIDTNGDGIIVNKSELGGDLNAR